MSINNVSRELHEIPPPRHQPNLSLDLKSLLPGQVVIITFGDVPLESTIIIKIDKPGGPGYSGKSAALGQIIACSFKQREREWFKKEGIPLPREKDFCAIAGACVKDTQVRAGAKEYEYHKVIKGKHLYWSIESPTEYVVIMEPKVSSVQIVPQSMSGEYAASI